MCIWNINHLGSDCPIITVTLGNEVSSIHPYIQGDYELSDSVNGKSSWKKGDYAIWYVSGYWVVGDLNILGQIDTGLKLAAWDEFSGLLDPSNQWFYWDDTSYSWLYPLDPNDIQVACYWDPMDWLYCIFHCDNLSLSIG